MRPREGTERARDAGGRWTTREDRLAARSSCWPEEPQSVFTTAPKDFAEAFGEKSGGRNTRDVGAGRCMLKRNMGGGETWFRRAGCGLRRNTHSTIWPQSSHHTHTVRHRPG